MNLIERTRTRWSTLLVTAGVTAVVLGPLLLNGGIALRGDMVFTPDQPWKPAWLGLGGSVPRAVPMDALVSIADEVLPGAVLQRIVLVAAFLLGGVGIARVCTAFSATAQVAAVVFFLWNPWVLERLSIGQWPMVLGYGLLPWLVLAVGRLRDGRVAGWSGTTVLLVLCAVCAPSMGLIAVLVGLVLMAPNWTRLLGVLGIGVLANLPWLLPALLGGTLTGDRSQFDAFAARGESSLGTLASLVSMGGIWKSSVVPPERTQALVIGVALLIALACVGGLLRGATTLGSRTAGGLLATGGVFLLIALLPAIGPLGRGLGDLSTHIAAVGILRDSHRYLAPLGLVLAVGAAALVDWLLERRRTAGPGPGALALLVVLAPILLLPSLAWGLAGELRPVHYPDDWDRVATLTGQGPEGAVVVLPWRGNYRGYAWNDRRAVLDPAERYLSGEVLIDDRLFVGDQVLRSEDRLLAKVGTALEGADPRAELSGLGVRWVLVEKENGVDDAEVPLGVVAFDGPWLRLVDLGEPAGSAADHRRAPPSWPVVSADLVVFSALWVSFLHLWRRMMRNHRKDR